MPVAQARADEFAWPGLRSAGGIVGDVAHGHLFVSEGADQAHAMETTVHYSRVVVTDLRGHLVKTLSGLGGPGALALSGDGGYVDVALWQQNAIARIDTSSLQITETLQLPSEAGCPDAVAETAGKIWYSFHCGSTQQPGGGLAYVQLPSRAVTVLSADDSSTAPDRLLTAQQQPGLLVATYGNGATIASFDADAPGLPTTMRPNEYGRVALSPDGNTAYLAGYSGVFRVPLNDPAAETQISSTHSLDAAASSDGQHLLVSGANGLCALNPLDGSVQRCSPGDFWQNFNSGSDAAPPSVASLGGASAAAVVVPQNSAIDDVYEPGPPGAEIAALDDPTHAATRLSLAVPNPYRSHWGHSASIPSGQSIQISGTFTAPSPGGIHLGVMRVGPLGVSMPLLPLTTDSSGTFMITDRPIAVGRYRYVVSYGGSSTQSPTSSEFDLDVQAPVQTVSLGSGSRPLDAVDDPIDQREFVSDYAHGEVRAYDDTGNLLGTVSNLPGAFGLLMAPDDSMLYVAVSGANEIVAVDPTTMVITRVWPTGNLPGPVHLAQVGQRILVSYYGKQSNGSYTGGIATFDPSSQLPLVTALSVPAGGPFQGALMAASPDDPNTVVAADPYPGFNAYLFQVGSTSLTTVAQTHGCLAELTLTADDKSVYCDGDVLTYNTLTSSAHLVDLTSAVDSPSGQQRAGWAVFSWDNPMQIHLQSGGADDYGVSASTQFPVRSSTGSPNAGDGLGALSWTGDGNHLFATGWNDDNSDYPSGGHLDIVDTTPTTPVTITATPPTAAKVGVPLTITGTIVDNSATPVTNVGLRILKATGTRTVALASVTSNASGKFTIVDTPTTSGTTRYYAEYDGSLHQAPADGVVTVGVQPDTPVAAATGTNNAVYLHIGSTWKDLGGTVVGAPAVVSNAGQLLVVATGTNHVVYVRNLSTSWQRLTPSSYCLDRVGAAVQGGRLYVGCEASNHHLYVASAAIPRSGLPSTNEWSDLGGSLTYGPAVGLVNNTITYAVTTPGGRIYTRTPTTNFVATSFYSLAAPSLVRSLNGTSYLAYQATNHSMYYATRTASATSWSSAKSLGNTVVGGPGIAALSTGAVFFIEATNHAIYQCTATTSWTSLGNQVNGGASATAD